MSATARKPTAKPKTGTNAGAKARANAAAKPSRTSGKASVTAREAADRALVDDLWMRAALDEAAQGLGRTTPNPAVGCILVRDGREVARGHYRGSGGPHAEAVALHKAGSRARGATAYVTLEPHAHQGRTPPCTDALIRGVIENRPKLDAEIMKFAKNWDLHRMAVVDRNILRLAIYEMLHREDIPPVVSINEAVDIAKMFSTDDSGRFVNGILDKVRQELMRPARSVK